MKDMINDIYNRLLNFFQNDAAEEHAKDLAYNRLKLVLMQDRLKLDAISMESLKKDILQAISKYVEVDSEALDLTFAGEGEAMALMFNIPVIRTKTREEIDKSLEENSDEIEPQQNEDENSSEAVEAEEENQLSCNCQCDLEETQEDAQENKCEESDKENQ